MLNVARWIPRSVVNGPGERFVLWLQGCPLRCPGCWNPDTWDFEPREVMDADTLVELVLATPDIEGITLTGGEPLSQAAGLVPAVRRLREAGLSVLVFTGYELAELRGSPARGLLELTDVVVTGRYVEEQRDLSLTWRGSANQSVSFLTDRYSVSDVADSSRLHIEAHIGRDGEVVLTGFPRFSEGPRDGERWPT